MKTFTKFQTLLIPIVSVFFLIMIFSSCGPSRSEYDKIQKENIVLKDSLTKLSDRFINGERYFDNIIQLLDKKKYKDAKDSIVVFRLTYPESKLSYKTDSIEKIISSKTKEVLLNKTELYKYLVAVYQSNRQYNGNDGAFYNYKMASKVFPELQFVNEKDKQSVKEILASLPDVISSYDPESIRFAAKNMFYFVKLKIAAESIKILEISNE